MIKPRILLLPLAFAMLAACAQDTTTPLDQEIMLAQQAEQLARDEAQRTHAAYEGWLGRLLAALRGTDNPEAQAFLETARAEHRLAHEAWAMGDREAAREHHHAALIALLSAVVVVFPEAPVATGEAVDRIVERIESFLGEREAPRIRRILEHVKELRVKAEAALAADEPVAALELNLRAFQILHRLGHHIRYHVRDHDREAEDAMLAVDF
jgi:hypothetical protein